MFSRSMFGVDVQMFLWKLAQLGLFPRETEMMKAFLKSLVSSERFRGKEIEDKFSQIKFYRKALCVLMKGDYRGEKMSRLQTRRETFAVCKDSTFGSYTMRNFNKN